MRRSGTNDRYAEYQTQLLAAMRALLPTRGLPLIDGDRRVRWSDRVLVIGAVLLSWLPGSKLQEAFAATRETLVAMYPTRRRPGRELSGFLKALRKRSAGLLSLVTKTLRERTAEQAGRHWRWKQWVVLGVDGSRINSPRTVANEEVFGCAGKTRTAPQQLLLTIFHVATGLPWAWRRGAGDASERHLLRDALPELPEHTLLLADAGFTGYDLLGTLQRAGQAFIVRAGANVSLLRKLGYRVREERNTVYLWPVDEQRKNKPLVLRLVVLGSGEKRVALLTNVLDQAVLSKTEIKALYRQRWSIEVMFRSLKQTMGKRTLRAETPNLAQCELDWALAGFWMLGLMTLAATGVKQGWSPAGALDVVRRVVRHRQRRAGTRRLRTLLRGARPDRYHRFGPKKARDWPRKKNDRPPGTPKPRMAKPPEIAAAKRLREQNCAA
ncbi:MAG: IS4 family transposase [Phycisphaerae bacterium]|nr:IS4 family transposase [Phycisphaerae bacterium]